MIKKHRTFLYNRYYSLPEIKKKAGKVEFYEDHEEGEHYVIVKADYREYWFHYENEGYILDHN